MRRFWLDRKGNIAVLFAFAIVPIIGGIGAAIDYSMANSYRTDMQKALDSTALALTKILPADDATINSAGMEYFLASMGNHDLTNLQLTITEESGTVRLRVTGDYTPAIANILGAQQFQIGTVAEAKWSLGKLEIALVLDNSGSMGSLGRMTALKAATHDLLNVLENAAREPGDAKVAIVPFDSAVRLPFTQANAPNWIKWGTSGSCSIPSSWWYNTGSQLNCIGAGGVWTWGSWTNTKWSSWSGCVEDRDKDPSVNHDVLDTVPDNTTSTNTSARRTKYPARNCDDNDLRRLTPLTANWTTLRDEVDAMQPAGWTNITIGLAWGWHVLSPTERYTEGAAYGTENLTKYIILMTDGDNTRNRYASCNGCSGINDRTEVVCTNIKNAGIKIYSIRLIAGNADLIRDCATNPSMYYDVQNAGQLSNVFNSIGSEIASLHLSK